MGIMSSENTPVRMKDAEAIVPKVRTSTSTG
jgi:hypothetical protein